jgi:hypothetical protein
MTEGTSLESKIAVLAKRIDDQARFTRAVTVICSTAVLGVMFYMMTEIFSTLPAVIYTNFLGQMDKTVYMWRATEAGANARSGIKPAATTSSTAPSTTAGTAASPAPTTTTAPGVSGNNAKAPASK